VGLSLDEQVAAIRAEVALNGSCTVGCEELRLLCPDELSVPEQFARIARIAQRERWSFAFLPDGSVHFSIYAASG
jgi:hypothetical protein